MQEHWNFAQFYCISVTNFSTVSEYILLEIIWIKRTFSSHSYGCFFVCMQCTLKNHQLIFYGRYLPFVRCRSRDPRHERKQSMCLSARWQSDMRCTQQYVVSLDRKLNANSSGVNAVVVYKHLWLLERIFMQASYHLSQFFQIFLENLFSKPFFQSCCPKVHVCVCVWERGCTCTRMHLHRHWIFEKFVANICLKIL